MTIIRFHIRTIVKNTLLTRSSYTRYDELRISTAETRLFARRVCSNGRKVGEKGGKGETREGGAAVNVGQTKHVLILRCEVA